jgi:hypothetical protein
MVRWCFSSFNFLLNFRNERYLQSQWPLAAKYGTRFANSLQGSDFAYVSYNGRGGGGILFLFLLLDAVSLYPRDIFSVVKVDSER